MSQESPKIKKKKKGDFHFTVKEIQFFENGIAEHEQDSIVDIYLENEYLQEAKDFSSLKTFFIARTGIGKSAIIENIKATCEKKFVVQIDPDTFMPQLLRNTTTLSLLEKNGINIDYFLKTLWKFVITVELLKRRYGTDKKGLIEKWKMSDDVQKKAYHFLEKFKALGPSFSITERVLGFVDELTKRFELSFEKAGFKLSTYKTEFSVQEIQLLKDTLKEFEFVEVNDLVKNLDEYLSGESYFILIDDLDKAWDQSGLGSALIKSLFLSMTDIANLKFVKPVVSLRTNLFTQIKFPQPEKMKPFIRKMAWSDNDLKGMIDLRFKHLYGLDTNYIWQNIFPHEIHYTEGEPVRIHKYLMLMSNRRPRDLFYLISCAMKYSKGKNRLTQESFRKGEQEFSEDRLINFIAEWESPYSGLKDILEYFRGVNIRMTGGDLRGIIDNIIIEMLDGSKGELYHWAKKGIVSDTDDSFGDPQGVFMFLYQIGIIGFKDDQHKIHFSFDHDQKPISYKLTDQTSIFLNPALGWAITGTPQTKFSAFDDKDLILSK